MKSAEELSLRIKSDILHALSHPKLWFNDPKSMEVHIFYMTDLLSFLHDSEEKQYGDYLIAKGFQTALYTTRIKETSRLNSDELLINFREFFLEFFLEFYESITTT